LDPILLLRQLKNFFALKRLKNSSCKKIIILCEARTGSGLLSDLLNSVEDITIGGEILNPKVGNGIWPWASKETSLKHIKNSLSQFGTKYGGIKLHYSHFTKHNIKVHELVHKFPDTKFILLYRSSITNQFISSRITQITKQFGTRNQAKEIKRKLVIEPDFFKAYCCERIRELQIMKKDLQKNHSDYIEIQYEEIVENPQKLFNEKLFPFLNINPRKVTTNLKKQNQKSKPEIIENYDALKDLFEEFSNYKLG
jgi:LPS sulfotransferase NodH